LKSKKHLFLIFLRITGIDYQQAILEYCRAMFSYRVTFPPGALYVRRRQRQAIRAAIKARILEVGARTAANGRIYRCA
jgi:hypothetical protein